MTSDQKLRWAIAVLLRIRFYHYQVSFKLIRHLPRAAAPVGSTILVYLD